MSEKITHNDHIVGHSSLYIFKILLLKTTFYSCREDLKLTIGGWMMVAINELP